MSLVTWSDCFGSRLNGYLAHARHGDVALGDMHPMRAVLFVPLAALLAGGCTQPADPPQSHVGTCSHYNDPAHRFEDVPNCLLRRHDTLINGLPPIDTNQQP